MGFEVLAVLAEALARALEFHDRAERATARCGLSKLLGDVGARGGFRQIAAGLPDHGADHLGISEPLKERDEVGKRFVKGRHIRPAGNGEVCAQTVEQRVSDFMSDYVVRQSGIKTPARQVVTHGSRFVAIIRSERETAAVFYRNRRFRLRNCPAGWSI